MKVEVSFINEELINFVGKIKELNQKYLKKENKLLSKKDQKINEYNEDLDKFTSAKSRVEVIDDENFSVTSLTVKGEVEEILPGDNEGVEINLHLISRNLGITNVYFTLDKETIDFIKEEY